MLEVNKIVTWFRVTVSVSLNPFTRRVNDYFCDSSVWIGEMNRLFALSLHHRAFQQVFFVLDASTFTVVTISSYLTKIFLVLGTPDLSRFCVLHVSCFKFCPGGRLSIARVHIGS